MTVNIPIIDRCPCGCGVNLDRLRPPHAPEFAMRKAVEHRARMTEEMGRWQCLWCGTPTPGRMYCSYSCRDASIANQAKRAKKPL